MPDVTPEIRQAAKIAVLQHTDTQRGQGGLVQCLCGRDMLTLTEHCQHVADHVLAAVVLLIPDSGGPS